MKAQELIQKLDLIKDTMYSTVSIRNKKTKSEIELRKEHGLFKLILENVIAIIFFDDYKESFVFDENIQLFFKDVEIARIEIGEWEMIE